MIKFGMMSATEGTRLVWTILLLSFICFLGEPYKMHVFLYPVINPRSLCLEIFLELIFCYAKIEDYSSFSELNCKRK